MIRLIRQLTRAYRRSLALVLAAMLVETLMSLAAPWPLKIVLDNVLGGRRLPDWMNALALAALGNNGKQQIAIFAAFAVILIAIFGAAASYFESYTTETVAQGIAHDLRMRTYHHLQRL